jgi:hypothetical protein
MEAQASSPVEDGTKSKKKIILIGLGVAAAGISGYFGWQWWKNHKAAKDDSGDSNDTLPPPPDKKSFHSSLTTGSSHSDEFPLKKGSKGAKVKSLQRGLIAKYGKSALPRYGADGDFGNETISALKKNSLPEEIDETTYNVIVQGAGSSSSIDAKGIAGSLYEGATNSDIEKVISALKQMASIGDYSAVNREFENYSIGGVRKTLVNGLLTSFSDESQKQRIRLEFSRMGLKYDGTKWSLSGIAGCDPVITTESCYVWANPKEAIKVPAKMILGNCIDKRGDYLLFENNGKHFLVKTKSIKLL